MSPADAPHPTPRVIKSFVRRAGRTTAGQLRAHEDYGAQFLVSYESQCTRLDTIFSHRPLHPTILEIGFGMGETTAHIARTLPDCNFLCCEVHPPGVGALLKRAGHEQLDNIRIIAHDAVEVLEHMLPPTCLAGVHIFFPDPWHKTRHNKRRLIQMPFLDLLISRLQSGSYLHLATDWQEYAEQMLELLGSHAQLRNTQTSGGYAPRPAYRCLTKFEQRGLRLGHGVWDLVFSRI